MILSHDQVDLDTLLAEEFQQSCGYEHCDNAAEWVLYMHGCSWKTSFACTSCYQRERSIATPWECGECRRTFPDYDHMCNPWRF